MRAYGPLFEHLLGAHKPIRLRWTYIELLDRVDWIDDYLKSQRAGP